MERQGEAEFLFVGNAHWLDFVNTERLLRGRNFDRVSTPGDLARWAVAATISGENSLRRSVFDIEQDPAASAALIAEARALRSALRQLASALNQAAPVPQEIEPALNAVMASQPLTLRLDRTGEHFHVAWRPVDGSLRGVLGAIARDAAQFLAHADASMVRACANPNCGIYFHDVSKNHTRRWCSMELCGNRIKVAKHRAKHFNRAEQPITATVSG